MENELPIHDQGNTLQADSLELLTRFLIQCKSDTESQSDRKEVVNSSADLVTAVYYYRRYSDVNEFISKYLKNNNDYFHIQWIRTTWDSLSKMSDAQISELVINQITIIANPDEEE
ncbi:MAG: hypothetical protein A3B68_03375 [Candidatus Melainabacteria bacterium RIFCSPHIGHO2_02_FULL_34_12]|nr:MAG: hypothetical protein A3B68_03375 [Candidatus Melainabacteria bacterium RIFCSPHIGHO2_02_FULL_34_12]